MEKVHNIAMALPAAYLSMHRRTNAYLLRHGVTADQFVCLTILSQHNGTTQQELARLATSDPNTMRAMLILLDKQGLVKRKQHPGDGRVRCVKITRKGRKIYEKLWQELGPLHELLANLFEDEEANRLVAALMLISKAMTGDEIMKKGAKQV